MTNARISSFERALAKLETALNEPETEMNRDATIQHFEFTFELSWKAVQSTLKEEGRQCQSPRACLREAFKQGWIDDEPAWMQMVEDRNRTSHTYDETFARQLYQRLVIYPPLFHRILAHLQSID